jgi:hypothetical protein
MITAPHDLATDIPLELAVRAHAGTSMVPDDRGRAAVADYVAQLTTDLAALARFATTPAKQEQLAAEFARYREGYRMRYLVVLQGKARCVSTLVAGRSNFPVRRAQKASDAAHNHTQELHDYRQRALKAIHRVLCPEDEAIMAGAADAVSRLQAEIEKGERELALYKAINVAIRKNARKGQAAQVEALVALEVTPAQAAKLLVPDDFRRIGIPPYMLSNLGNNLRRLRGRLEQVQAAKATPDTTEEGSGARLEDSPADNRVRLYFGGKPDEGTRAQLKARGFRWTPSLGCWQAYRNTGSIETARKLAGL